MKIINRAKLRGKPLDDICKKAKPASQEYANDNRVFCMGYIDARTEEAVDECLKCRAYIWNATPPRENNR